MISSSSSSATRVYRTSVFSRERNRMHARKTRQRKKEHVQKLQHRVDQLKAEHIRLRLAISEKNTASILVDLFQKGSGDGEGSHGTEASDPRVEMLLKRSADDIPDASKIPELPALILPGNGKRKVPPGDGRRKSADGDAEDVVEIPSKAPDGDGIDYALLGKDRAACSPAELDRMRRERNRMHARRTRDRKRIFVEELEAIIDQLEGENSLLQGHLIKLDSKELPPEKRSESLTQPISPALGPMATPPTSGSENANGDFLSQIESLLAAAGSFRKQSVECETNAISCTESDDRSDRNSCDEEEEEDFRTNHQLSGSFTNQRQRRMTSNPSPSVPKSITTTNLSLG